MSKACVSTFTPQFVALGPKHCHSASSQHTGQDVDPSARPCHLEGQPGIGSVECRHQQQPSGGEAKVRLGSAAEQSFATGGAGTPNPAPTPPQTPGGDGLQRPEGAPLGPRGLARCLECSCRTKAAGVLDKAKEGGDSEASRPSHCSTCTSASLNFHLKCRVCSSYTSCSAPPAHMHALTKVLQLEDGKVSDSSSTSDSSYSDSSSSTSSEEEAMPEYVPNPSLPPPPEYPSDDEYGMPNPSLGPQSEVLTMTSTWRPQLQPPPAKRAMNVQPSASGARNGKKSFGLWLNPTSSLRNG